MPPILSCKDLTCHREQWNESGPAHIEAVTASFEAGTFTGLCGPDGSGKGLLLNVLGLLEPHDSGSIAVNDLDLGQLGDEEARQVRNENFGFLFNHPCLLPSFSVAENVAMPLFRICGGDAQGARMRTMEILDFCGMADLEGTLAGRLDLVTQRKVALARALIHSPRILIAISPRESEDLLNIARRVATDFGLCVLWAGEESEISRPAHRLLHLRNGQVVTESIA